MSRSNTAQSQAQPGLWSAFKQTISAFIEDDVFTLSGALAFFAALSFAPLVILLMWAASFFGEETQEQIVTEMSGIVGEAGGDAIEIVLRSGEANPRAGTVAGLLSLGVLLFSATTVFAQLQKSLNRIWGVKANPGAGVWNWLRKRILSLGMVIAIAFLLIISMVADMIVAMLVGPIIDHGWMWQVLSLAVSLGVFILLFAVIFKYLPDVEITWRVVWVGAAITAVLFTLGKFLIGLYLGQGGVSSVYGATGSVIALLIWVYYTSLVVFYGAEVTQVYAHRTGERISPPAMPPCR
ncbi:MAG: YihY/virulence factor BrkB family protein [Phycisphaerales bacterium]|nr:YihY/virulence factor BrkB family protein [Planctomycetota bacterium]MCH8507343.1 YihY/virulence factor BrkB family protein [Phycisphaerales bacterium]